MSAGQFSEWLHQMRLSHAAAAKALGVHRNSIAAWADGRTPIDQRTALACAAIYHRLEPWS